MLFLAIKRFLIFTIFLLLLGFTFTSSAAVSLKFNPNVKENKSKNIVQSIQTALIEAGYDPGLPDGFKGPRTEAALKAFQRDHKLMIDGQANSSTLKAIKNSLVSDN